MGVRFLHFFFWDSVRTLLTCPISVWVGYRFGTCAQEIIAPYKELLLLVVVVVIAVLVLRELARRRGLKARAMSANGRNGGTRNAA
jgi:membrane protein DedA with SNARE-associated domain